MSNTFRSDFPLPSRPNPVTNRYLVIALKEAAHSECRYKVGAVLVKGGRVLGRSCNRRRNSPRTDFRHATFHAEEALMRGTDIPPRTVVYVARLSRTGAPLLARPCPRCQRLLAARGITLAHYTTGSGSGTLRMS
ncbi:hypothetical protein LKL35_37090 [Streptomyces sp. ET3-23]|uniref:hypothetical protein n=1 Tax=Streptomyces sp. ET3-23 TaxID=2885643 RepID=UPI001D11178D|nr:hypothetical protein [Streptomyces sp. ET3-23]